MRHDFLYRRFVQDAENTDDLRVRRRYGTLVSVCGLIANFLLAALKISLGVLSGSLALTADGFNNFSDMAASAASLIGFHLAARPADEDHPFGHARIEYIAASLIGLLTLVIAWEIGKRSFLRILQPEAAVRSLPAILLTLAAILVKLWLYSLNRQTGKKIDSPVMHATAVDSLADVLASSAVLLTLLLDRWTRLPLDGLVGLLVALFILKAGLDVLRGTFNALIGEQAPLELQERILAAIRLEEGVLGVHDLIVHNYGPGRLLTSCHVEVDAAGDVLELHSMIDRIERQVGAEIGVSLLIHMDPVITDDPQLERQKEAVEGVLAQIDGRLSLHDFRVAPGHRRTSLLFDVVVPSGVPGDDQTLKRQIDEGLQRLDPNFISLIVFDRNQADSSMD